MTPQPGSRAVGSTPAVAAIEFLQGLRAGLEAGLAPEAAAELAAAALPESVRKPVRGVLARLRGDNHEDEWGFDEELAETAYPVFELLYERWWRVRCTGVGHVPSHGRAMLVANHAGSLLPFDAAMITTALMKEHPLPRWPRFMALDWAFAAPFLGPFIRKVGGVPANHANATRILDADELLMTFPEGAKGSGKRYSERYQVQRFGRGGFVEIALRTGTPIVPVAVIGAEETYPMIADAAPLARLLGAPFAPITPTFPWLGPLGLVPLPSRWRIEFCAPVDLSPYPPEAAEDRRLVLDLSEAVREKVAGAVRENLLERGPAFG